MSSNEATTKKQPKEHRDLRLRKQHFPEGERLVFDTAKKGFVPLAIIMRKLLRYVSPPELRVLVYLLTRCSKYSICYPTLEELAYDLSLTGRRNLTPHLKELERKQFISTTTAGGKKYFLVHDPRVAIYKMLSTGEIDDSGLAEINDVLRDLNQDEIEYKPNVTKAPASPARKK
jgi:hypothetical protein